MICGRRIHFGCFLFISFGVLLDQVKEGKKEEKEEEREEKRKFG